MESQRFESKELMSLLSLALWHLCGLLHRYGWESLFFSSYFVFWFVQANQQESEAISVWGGGLFNLRQTNPHASTLELASAFKHACLCETLHSGHVQQAGSATGSLCSFHWS